MKLPNLFFWLPETHKGAKIIIKKGNGYLSGKQGYVVKIVGRLADVRVKLPHDFGYEKMYSAWLTTDQFFLESPELYPTLPTSQLRPKKKGGGMKVKMPRLFRFAFWAAVIFTVWKIVLSLDVIANFAVHTFFK